MPGILAVDSAAGQPTPIGSRPGGVGAPPSGIPGVGAAPAPLPPPGSQEENGAAGPSAPVRTGPRCRLTLEFPAQPSCPVRGQCAVLESTADRGPSPGVSPKRSLWPGGTAAAGARAVATLIFRSRPVPGGRDAWT